MMHSAGEIQKIISPISNSKREVISPLALPPKNPYNIEMYDISYLRDIR